MSSSHYQIISPLTEDDVDRVLKLFQHTWWANNRTKEEIRVLLQKSSLCIGIISDQQKLIGFGRVLSDTIEKATIYDIIVDPLFRGQSIDDLIIKHLCQSKYCEHVRHIELYCMDEMIRYYESLGFREISVKLNLLRITKDR